MQYTKTMILSLGFFSFLFCNLSSIKPQSRSYSNTKVISEKDVGLWIEALVRLGSCISLIYDTSKDIKEFNNALEELKRKNKKPSAHQCIHFILSILGKYGPSLIFIEASNRFLKKNNSFLSRITFRKINTSLTGPLLFLAVLSKLTHSTCANNVIWVASKTLTTIFGLEQSKKPLCMA